MNPNSIPNKDDDKSETIDFVGKNQESQKKSNNSAVKLLAIGLFCGVILFVLGGLIGAALENYIVKIKQSTALSNDIPTKTQRQIPKVFPKTDKNGGFIASNANNNDEQQIIDMAEKKCHNLKCCREDDDVETDSEGCRQLPYLQCLSPTNGCIWDCSKGNSKNGVHFKHKFTGINGGLGDPVDVEHVDPGELANNLESEITLPITSVIDECGTTYELELDEKSKQEVEKKLNNLAENHKNSIGGKEKNENRKLIEMYKTEYKDLNIMNKEEERRLYTLGADGRVPVTTWSNPYYKVVYITYDTSEGSKRCSGAFITPRHIITAGHCVSDGKGNWYSNWRIMPSYNAGGWETLYVYQAWTFNGWRFSSKWEWDIAILTLQTATWSYGWFAFGYNNGITSSWLFETAGYPSDKGTIMQRQWYYMDYSITYDLLRTKTGDINGGNSGGPTFLDSTSVIYAIVSHQSWLYGGNARITKEKFQAMCTYITSFAETSSHC